MAVMLHHLLRYTHPTPPYDVPLMLPTLLIANLGCEDTLANRPQRVTARKRAAAYGSLLRALATDEDTLWLPHSLAPERLTPHLPRPRIITGPVPAAEVSLPWCAAETWGGSPAVRLALHDPLVRRIWSVPRPDPAATATVNHKAFALLLGREWGEALPLAAAVTSIAQLETHLRQLPPGARWVAKHPLAAAGRARIWNTGQSLSVELRGRLSKLLESAGLLIVEPWMERTRDLGRVALLDEENMTLLARYQQRIGPKGDFRGIALDDPLAPPQSTHFDSITLRVGEVLRERGYRGPFSLDGWAYLHDEGEAIHYLGEINARITFGLLAHIIAQRHNAPAAQKLRFGDGSALTQAEENGPIWPLLLPAKDDDTAIWLQ